MGFKLNPPHPRILLFLRSTLCDCVGKCQMKVKVTQLCPTLCDHMDYMEFSRPDTGVGSCSLLQEIFPTQGLNWGLLHYRQILYQLSYQESLYMSRISSLLLSGILSSHNIFLFPKLVSLWLSLQHHLYYLLSQVFFQLPMVTSVSISPK